MYKFRGTVAMKYGITAAVVAEFLWDKVNSKEYDENRHVYNERVWCRCSVIMMRSMLPFLTRHQIEDAIYRLRENSVIKKDCCNENKFDHTSWYSFTESGILLMSKK